MAIVTGFWQNRYHLKNRGHAIFYMPSIYLTRKTVVDLNLFEVMSFYTFFCGRSDVECNTVRL